MKRPIAAPAGRVSLILPLAGGSTVARERIAEFRSMLGGSGPGRPVEVIIAWDDPGANARFESLDGDDDQAPWDDADIHVVAEQGDWPALVQAGLRAASGDLLIVLDVDRQYAPDSLARLIGAIAKGEFDLAVAVPNGARASWARQVHPRRALRLVSRLLLGTSDVFSGLYAFRRSLWEQRGPAEQPSLDLDALLRHGARSVDVPVAVQDGFRAEYLGFQDLRPLKHLLDGRFGNYSRLVQFCLVGASGMVVDLSFYAFFQWLLSFTILAERQSVLFGCPWHLAVAAALAIAIAMVWNFTLNRRLTFSYARNGSIIRQFANYALYNALAILLSFSVRLYLPEHVGFFGRHKLAAAVVGIVAATGISFSMSRWVVFANRADAKASARRARERAVSQPTGTP